jgi:hypothetical protein
VLWGAVFVQATDAVINNSIVKRQSGRRFFIVIQRVSKFQSFKVSKFQSFKVSDFRFQISNWHGLWVHYPVVLQKVCYKKDNWKIKIIFVQRYNFFSIPQTPTKKSGGLALAAQFLYY